MNLLFCKLKNYESRRGIEGTFSELTCLGGGVKYPPQAFLRYILIGASYDFLVTCVVLSEYRRMFEIPEMYT